MKDIEVNNIKYEVVTDYKEALDIEELKEKLTDYFNDFDYIVGDWAYSKLRLKGFYKEDNKKVSKINNIKDLDSYLINNCAYGCKYFVLLKK